MKLIFLFNWFIYQGMDLYNVMFEVSGSSETSVEF